ncbi:hypothetical protein [Thalassiella azotivora]
MARQRPLLTALVALSLSLASAAAPAQGAPESAAGGQDTKLLLEPGSCYATVDRPHYSSGAGGVIAKIRFRCDVGYTMRFNSWIGNLYRCSRQPAYGAGESRWTRDYGCISVATNSSTDNGGALNLGSGSFATRYIPKTGRPGATRVSGAWYIACVRGYKGPSNTPFSASSIAWQA